MSHPTAELLATLPCGLALEVDALCDDFERHWQRARRRAEPLPAIESFLPRAPLAARDAFRLCLAALERDLCEGAILPRIPGLDLEAEIGRGGMGVVYRARETTGHLVAVKLIHGIESFAFTELAELQHPHLIPLERCGQYDAMPYLVMPLAKGGDLRERFAEWKSANHRPDWRQAAELIEKVARAVGYLHRNNILHRDLKPSNILLTEPGGLEPLVCDFGLAARADDCPDGRLTGTPTYMAPEQRNGRTLSPAADVWSLGVVLSEWVLDSPLTSICHRCQKLDPQQRYPSADTLAEELCRIRHKNTL